MSIIRITVNQLAFVHRSVSLHKCDSNTIIRIDQITSGKNFQKKRHNIAETSKSRNAPNLESNEKLKNGELMNFFRGFF